jgi:hypothetical protein
MLIRETEKFASSDYLDGKESAYWTRTDQIGFRGPLYHSKNGGDDGTRTRGLCRDRAAF